MKLLKFYFFILFFGVNFSPLFGQTITVKDKVSQQPVPNVKVYSVKPKVQKKTDIDGRLDIQAFKKTDTIYISFPSYNLVITNYEKLSTNTDVELVETSLQFGETTVTASRWKQDKIKVPGKVTSLDLKELELLAPQTSADLLENSGYVFVQKSQLAGGSPQLRGFGTNRVMIVVDGVRMNNAIFRSGNLQNVISLDANSLESVDVMFGPGSVMYGSDAIGGVMNFQTKQPEFAPDSLKTFAKTNVYARYSSASHERTGHFDMNVSNQKWASLTTFSYSYFDDLTTGKYGNQHFLRPTYQLKGYGADSTVVNPNPRKQVHSGYQQMNAFQKISYRPNENVQVNYSGNFSTTSNAPRYDRLILDKNDDGILDNSEWYYGPQQWMMHRLGVHYSKKTKAFDEFRIVFAYQRYKESRHDRKYGKSKIRRQFEQVNAFTLNADFEKKFGKRILLFYGAEGVFNHVKSNAYRKHLITGEKSVINSRYPNNSTWQSYGAYASAEFDITDKWILHGGLRYSFNQIDATFDTTLFAFPMTKTRNQNGSLNGSLGLVFNPNKSLQLYLNGSTGFRAPNIDDLGKVFDSEPGSVIIPNVDLKPEYAYNGEFGFAWMLKGKLRVDGAVYYTYLQNALARGNYQLDGQDSILYEGQLSQVQAVQNLSNAYVYGVQGGIEWNFAKGFTLESTISYQVGEDFIVDSNAYFPKNHVAPLFGRTSITYKTRRLRVKLYANYQASMRPDQMPLNERGDFEYAKNDKGESYTPSWYTLNLKGTYFFNKHLSATLGFENLTNQLYRTFGSGISAPGFNVIVGLKVAF